MPKTILLLAGDILAIGIVTLIGFTTHGETNTAALPRMLTTFLPLTASWLVIAPLLGLFNLEATTNPRQLWRPLVGMLFAGPLAALVRAMVLNTVVIPIFGLVLSGSAGFGMFVWRVLWYFLQRSRKI